MRGYIYLTLFLNILGYSQSKSIEPFPTTKEPSRYYYWIGCSEGYRFSSSKFNTNCHFSVEKNIARNFVNLLSVGGTINATNLTSNTPNFSTDGYLSVLSLLQTGFRYTVGEGKPKYFIGGRVPVIKGTNAHLSMKYIPRDKYAELGLSVNLNRKKSHAKKPKISFSSNSKIIPKDILKIKKIDHLTHYPEDQTISKIEKSIEAIFELKTPNLNLKFTENKKEDYLEVKRKLNLLINKYYSNHKNYEDYVDDYHTGLYQSFKQILKDEESVIHATKETKRIILDNVISLFNNKFSQEKKDHTKEKIDILMLQRLAQNNFFYSLSKKRKISEKRFASAMAFFNQIILFIKKGIDKTNQRWNKDSRLVWIPLHLGLSLSESQNPEIYKNAMSKVTKESFSKNKVSHIVSEGWFHEYIRSIHETKSFHGLLIHDIQGSNLMRGRDTDDIASWRMLIEGYLKAQIKNLEKLNSNQITIDDFPRFFIFLDSFYYSNTKPFKLFKALKNLGNLNALREVEKEITQGTSLSDQKYDIRANYSQYLGILQEKINESKILSRYSKEEINNLLKVNINITFPYDTSLFSQNFMTDHRKVFFKDLIESKPENAMAIYGGMGFGELYTGPNWEDRGIKVEGPAAIKLKDEINHILERHGINEETKGFRDYFVSKKEKTLISLNTKDFQSDTMVTFNRIDYDKKITSVASAFQFDLMEKGSALVIPDSLWLSDYWQNMMIAAALRGVNVYVIMNATGNIVSPFSAVLQRTREVFTKFYYVSKLLEKMTNKKHLRVGIYDSNIAVGEISNRFQKAINNFSKIPGDNSFINDLQMQNGLDQALKNEKPRPQYIYNENFETNRPFMHLKMHLYLSYNSIESLKELDLTQIYKNYIELRTKETNNQTQTYDNLNYRNIIQNINFNPENHIKGIMTYKLGSMNMDNRGQFIDAEAGVYVLGKSTLIPLTDFYLLMGLSYWPKTYEEIDERLEEQGSMGKFLLKLMKEII